MSYTDYTKVRRRISAFESDALFTKLLKATCARIHALSIFYEVGTKIRPQTTQRCPACIVTPVRKVEMEHHLTGPRYHIDFTTGVIFILKHPNDNILTQELLYLEEKVSNAFRKADSGSGAVLFSTILEHFNTVVANSEIEPLQLVANNVLSFNSGINIVYSCWVAL